MSAEAILQRLCASGISAIWLNKKRTGQAIAAEQITEHDAENRNHGVRAAAKRSI
jgi:hypothetical protein